MSKSHRKSRFANPNVFPGWKGPRPVKNPHWPSAGKIIDDAEDEKQRKLEEQRDQFYAQKMEKSEKYLYDNGY